VEALLPELLEVGGRDATALELVDHLPAKALVRLHLLLNRARRIILRLQRHLVGRWLAGPWSS